VASATALDDTQLDELTSRLAHLLNSLDLAGGVSDPAERESMRVAAEPPPPTMPPAHERRKEVDPAGATKSPAD
jgi:hypothetical protein